MDRTLWSLPFMFGSLDFRRRNIMASEAPRVWDFSISLLMILPLLVLPYQMVNMFGLISMNRHSMLLLTDFSLPALALKNSTLLWWRGSPTLHQTTARFSLLLVLKDGGLEIISSKHLGGSITSILRIGGKTTIWQDGLVTVLYRNSKH